jgi:hypothetical protein
MAARPLDLEVVRRNRPAEGGRFTVTADIANVPALRAELHGWLSANGWGSGLWSQFEVRVRYAGENKIRATVRA